MDGWMTPTECVISRMRANYPTNMVASFFCVAAANGDAGGDDDATLDENECVGAARANPPLTGEPGAGTSRSMFG